MDLEAFNQCLSYASTLSNGKIVDKISPIITTVFGVIIGFLLSIARENRKDKKTNDNKKSCILEDTKRVKSDILSVFKQSLAMIDAHKAKNTVVAHNLPPAINLVFINEYFSSVAHTYSTAERTSIIELTTITKNLNDYLIHFRGEKDLSSNPAYENILHNTLNHSIYCSALCDSIITGEKPEYDQLIKIADELNINSTLVEHMRLRKKETPS